jgi:hypothetical protein
MEKDIIIGDMFKKDITRPISGVIKVEEHDENLVYDELMEYVITKETAFNLDKFFSSLHDEKKNAIGNMGVWIAGFFGSGKSHFLKMVSYILDNKEIKGTLPFEIIKEKIHDPLVLSNIEQAVSTPKDVILFNIDSKAQAGDSQGKLVELFMRVFNEHRGYSGQYLWLAKLEEKLDNKGLYDIFKDSIMSKYDAPWEVVRKGVYFELPEIIDILVTIGMGNKESLESLMESLQQDNTLSIESFVDALKDYLQNKAQGHKIYFFIDEVGQFIGEKSDLMLNLQTIVEDIGIKMPGKVWIAVTSQAAIDSVAKNLHENDFSKIQGRFETRITMTSSNADDVIKKRLLEKKESHFNTLESYYAGSKVEINNLLALVQFGESKVAYANESEFAEIYPFVSYQFKLMQSILETIRKSGYSGKHLAQGERSLLSAFKEASEIIADKPLGSLVPFYLFYDTIDSFLDFNVKKTINQVRDDAQYDEADLKVLKTLFLLKDIKGLRPDIDTLVTLFAANVSDNKKAMKEGIMQSLDKLERHTLIHKTNDTYHFLTDEEQEINRKIKDTIIESHELRDFIRSILFDDILKSIRKSYNGYPLKCGVDDKDDSVPNADLCLKIITPTYKGAFSPTNQMSLNGTLAYNTDYADTLLVILHNENTLKEAIAYLRLKTFLSSPSDASTPNEEKIRREKNHEANVMRQNLISALRTDLDNASYYVNKKEMSLRSSGIENRIREGLDALVENVFLKKTHVERSYEDAEAKKIIKDNKLYAVIEQNKPAQADIRTYLETLDLHGKIPFQDIRDHFKRKPYGWNEPTIILCIISLKENNVINIYEQKEKLGTITIEVYNQLCSQRCSGYFLSLVQHTRKEDLDAVISAMREYFDVTFIEQDEQSVYEKTFTVLNEYRAKVGSISSKYAENVPYPGKHAVEAMTSILDEIQGANDSIYFYFTNFISKVKDLGNIIEEVTYAIQFFSNSKQAEIFKEMCQKREEYKKNSLYLSDEAKDAFQGIERILGSDSPYKEIHMLHRYKDIIEESLKSALDRVKPAVLEYLDSKETEIMEDSLQSNPVPVNEIYESHHKQLQEIRRFIEAMNDCLVLEATKGRIDGVVSAYYLAKDKKMQDDGEATETIIPMDVSTLLPSSTLLRNSDDIENFLSTIRKKLEEMLSKGTIRVR